MIKKTVCLVHMYIRMSCSVAQAMLSDAKMGDLTDTLVMTLA